MVVTVMFNWMDLGGGDLPPISYYWTFCDQYCNDPKAFVEFLKKEPIEQILQDQYPDPECLSIEDLSFDGRTFGVLDDEDFAQEGLWFRRINPDDDEATEECLNFVNEADEVYYIIAVLKEDKLISVIANKVPKEVTVKWEVMNTGEQGYFKTTEVSSLEDALDLFKKGEDYIRSISQEGNVDGDFKVVITDKFEEATGIGLKDPLISMLMG